MQNKSVKEIKEIVDNLKVDQYLEYIDILKSDERKSVQKMAVSLAKKLDAIRKVEARLEMINTYEKEPTACRNLLREYVLHSVRRHVPAISSGNRWLPRKMSMPS